MEAVLPNTLLPDVLESGEKQLDQIMQIHQTLCNTNRIPILVDGQRRGVVATFQDVKQLQNSEQKIRLKLHEKGLVAKYAFNDILGDSPAIRSTIQIARSYAASRASVLILGETGTGKELFAQSIHNASDRRDGPFVAINCAAVSNSLLESELFGYEAGSLPAPPGAAGRACLNWPTAVPCFWTRSARSPGRPRWSCCGSCRKKRSAGWAEAG
ncbi:sigma 54-interacting transcriptional regulator [Oscillibacter sp.]|uniref:sigma 54-interacting transcriptional regulator n=1 Tax=Oscillibacter sp. TaxID=1945593 RepID=UPI00257BC0BE|nr:sigma 54-interacting transcriptional regulator [Oscillibacter sp.]